MLGALVAGRGGEVEGRLKALGRWLDRECDGEGTPKRLPVADWPRALALLAERVAVSERSGRRVQCPDRNVFPGRAEVCAAHRRGGLQRRGRCPWPDVPGLGSTGWRTQGWRRWSTVVPDAVEGGSCASSPACLVAVRPSAGGPRANWRTQGDFLAVDHRERGPASRFRTLRTRANLDRADLDGRRTCRGVRDARPADGLGFQPVGRSDRMDVPGRARANQQDCCCSGASRWRCSPSKWTVRGQPPGSAWCCRMGSRPSPAATAGRWSWRRLAGGPRSKAFSARPAERARCWHVSSGWPVAAPGTVCCGPAVLASLAGFLGAGGASGGSLSLADRDGLGKSANSVPPRSPSRRERPGAATTRWSFTGSSAAPRCGPSSAIRPASGSCSAASRSEAP